MNIQSLIANMTLEDKISLCTGADFRHSKARSTGLTQQPVPILYLLGQHFFVQPGSQFFVCHSLSTPF